MAERVHPTSDSDSFQPDDSSSVNYGDTIPAQSHKKPPPGTYVIQLPKDQVYRVPPPENATRFNLYTHGKNNRPCFCRRFLLSFLLLATALLLLLGIASGLLFLILQPVSPRYSILSVSINGIKPTSSFSPQLNLTLRAENPNKNIGIYYDRNSSITVYFSNLTLCEGALPALYQPSSNVTVMGAKLKGSGVRLSSGVVKALQDSEKQGKVGLKVDIRAPMKLKVYSVKTWRIRVKVICEIWVKKITGNQGETKVMEEKCDHSLKLW